MNKTPLQQLDDEYQEKLRKLQDKVARTGIDDDTEYEDLRSSWVLNRTQLLNNQILNAENRIDGDRRR